MGLRAITREMRATDLIEKNCLKCKKVFKTQYREIFRGRGKFCSKKCSNTYKENRISKRNKQLDSGRRISYRKYFGKHEHRMMMEQILGRSLKKGEVVHHKDGNKRNNNPENLELFSSNAEHLREHLLINQGVCINIGCIKHQHRRNLCHTHYKTYLINREPNNFYGRQNHA